jgi:two-component system CheB/CheR fusion protein
MKKSLSDSPHPAKRGGKDEALPPKGKIFPVIGIGASAGGLEAIELFLKNIPASSGMAIVVVQHLDPTHKAIMVELLQRVTMLPVAEVTDRLKIKPGNVYVIPPNKDMSLLHGTLHLLDMVEPRGLRHPIDFFLRSMADDLRQHAVGVILSGMGSDGTLGLRAIKEKGGIVFVQDPATAKFDGMPRSAIDAGLADIVAPAEELPARIQAYLKQLPATHKLDSPIDNKDLTALEKVVILLRARTGHDFSLYKENTFYRRIKRRMGIHQIERIADYIRFMQENQQETQLLFKELLIGVTSFFRDPKAWEALKMKGFPALFAQRPTGGTLRVWVAGCSTGEEVYSLAILFREAIEEKRLAGSFNIQIFATDLDKDAIEKARSGVYPPNISADVSEQRLRRFFEKSETGGWRVSREIRELIVFAPHNIIMDPPFTKLDILICRNLLIYLKPELQKKLIPLFHYSLNTGGLLFLGSAETIGINGHLFEPLDLSARIFRQLHHSISPKSIDFPSAFSNTSLMLANLHETETKKSTYGMNLQLLADQYLIRNFTPAAVLTNPSGDIIYINGRTGKYLEPAAGKANWNIFAMSREGLGYELNLLFGAAIRQEGPVTKKGVVIEGNQEKQVVDLTVEQLKVPEALCDLILTVFRESCAVAASSAARKKRGEAPGNADVAVLEQELKEARDEIMAIREEMQSSQEELKSTNEEIQSANEELQSTNEEPTSSKEEMQSLNEELHTVNQELQSKVSDLSQTNNDMKNLLNSTDIATLFLDEKLNIRRFTNRTTSIIKLKAGDIGRPITDIVTTLEYPELARDAREVLHSLIFSEKNIGSAAGDSWFNVRIMPYRTLENRIDGLVITFSDITASKKYEKELQVTGHRFTFLMESIPEGLIVQGADGRIVMANREARRLFGISMKEMQGRTIDELPLSIVREDGSPLPPEEFPSSVALRSGRSSGAIVLGITPHSEKACRWVRSHSLTTVVDTAIGYPGETYTFFSVTQPVQT